MTGVPVINVNNACASGSTGLYLARTMVSSGALDCALAVRFERMAPRSLSIDSDIAVTPFDHHFAALAGCSEPSDVPLCAAVLRPGRPEPMTKYGFPPRPFRLVGWKNHHHSVNNPYAQFQKDFTSTRSSSPHPSSAR